LNDGANAAGFSRLPEEPARRGYGHAERWPRAAVLPHPKREEQDHQILRKDGRRREEERGPNSPSGELRRKEASAMRNGPCATPDLFHNRNVELRDRIMIDPRVLVGKPVIAGTRISVEFIVDLLAAGWSHEKILANYPRLSEQDILASLQYAGELLHGERVYPLATA